MRSGQAIDQSDMGMWAQGSVLPIFKEKLEIGVFKWNNVLYQKICKQNSFKNNVQVWCVGGLTLPHQPKGRKRILRFVTVASTWLLHDTQCAIPWLDNEIVEHGSGVYLGNACWRNQWMRNDFEVTLIWVEWAVLLAPQNKVAVHILGSMWLVPGDCWGHRRYTFLFPVMCLHSRLS